jgi:hypothetical protein
VRVRAALLLGISIEPLRVGQRLLSRLALFGRCIVLRSIRCRRFAIGAVLGVEMTGRHVGLSGCFLRHSMRYWLPRAVHRRPQTRGEAAIVLRVRAPVQASVGLDRMHVPPETLQWTRLQ